MRGGSPPFFLLRRAAKHENPKSGRERTHALGKTLSVAVNSVSHVYPASRPGRLSDLLREIDACGVDAFIVANPFLLPLVRDGKNPLKAKIHLSSTQPCFNHLAARFFIRRGISRLILPTQISPFEASGIIRECRAAGVETEIFDYRFCGCTYVNGRCDLHNPVFHTLRGKAGGPAPCRQGAPLVIIPAESPIPAGKVAELRERLAARINRPPLMNDAAAFFDFFLAGAGFLKFGTRLDPLELKTRKVAELRAMIHLAEKLSGALEKNRAREMFLTYMAAWRGPGSCRE